MPSRSETIAFVARVSRVSRALATDRVRITWKADDEIADLGWSHTDALDQLAALLPDDLPNTEPSRHPDFALIWIFVRSSPRRTTPSCGSASRSGRTRRSSSASIQPLVIHGDDSSPVRTRRVRRYPPDPNRDGPTRRPRGVL
jgi:hypothetical protein